MKNLLYIIIFLENGKIDIKLKNADNIQLLLGISKLLHKP